MERTHTQSDQRGGDLTAIRPDMPARSVGVLVLTACIRGAAALVDQAWQLSMKIGRIGSAPRLPENWCEAEAPDGRQYFFNKLTRRTQWERPRIVATPADTPALSGPPLAMFSPGGGKACLPRWFDTERWGMSGEQLHLPLEVEFLLDDYGSMSDEPFRRTRAKPRRFFTRCASGLGNFDVKTAGVAWSMIELSAIEALLVWRIDLPEGASKKDVMLPAGSQLYCSTQVWRGDELVRLNTLLGDLKCELAAMEDEEAQSGGVGGVLTTQAHAEARKTLEARVKKIERALPQQGVPTLEIPGPWPGTVTISTHGQVAVQRLTRGKMPNPLANVPEFGVVGSFELAPQANPSECLADELITEVDAVLCD